MKKILTIGLIAAAMISSASAALVDKSSVNFSAGTFAFEDMDAGVSLGMDIKGEKNIVGGLYLGAGINGEVFDASDLGTGDDLGLVLDIYPTLSYEITKNISVNTMYGYTVGQVGSETFDGTSYGVGADYKVSDKFSVGIDYKKSNLEFTTGSVEIDAERMNVSMAYKF